MQVSTVSCLTPSLRRCMHRAQGYSDTTQVCRANLREVVSQVHREGLSGWEAASAVPAIAGSGHSSNLCCMHRTLTFLPHQQWSLAMPIILAPCPHHVHQTLAPADLAWLQPARGQAGLDHVQIQEDCPGNLTRRYCHISKGALVMPIIVFMCRCRRTAPAT